MADFGDSSDIDVVCHLVAPKGRVFVDVGCGKGELSRDLAKHGAHVHGLDPDSVQLARNRLSQSPGVNFHDARAESISLPDQSADVVIFCRSLHHVELSAMPMAIQEAFRLLRRPNGMLIVIEPDINGSWSQLLKPFHDETEVRKSALRALDEYARPIFGEFEEHLYQNTIEFGDFGDFLASQTNVTFRATERECVDDPVVRALFEAAGNDGKYTFHQPLFVRLYRDPISI
tara:strand:+ start:848 stop:1540 length:693 start_codon:yes stop_codon:yes gene_type:complete